MTTTPRLLPKPPGRPLHVLVVDDSAVVRQSLGAILGRAADLCVATAADPLIAAGKMRRQRPDVIVLDLEMPRMDGLTFLRRLMADDPLPVIVCSALSGRMADAALRALEAGAVDVIAKPSLGVREFLDEQAIQIVDAVRAAAHARPCRRPADPRAGAPRLGPDAVLPGPVGPLPGLSTEKLIAVGASTGGTEALKLMLESLPPESPGLVIVQHMPPGFTRAFANRLDQCCRIEVKEAAEGDQVCDGRALIGPGDRHLVVRRDGSRYSVTLADGPLVSRHRPSVDVLFRSVARSAGPNAVGVLMTGMGDDGAAGLLEMKQAGATTLAQDESTCVVFGMPREAIARGAVDEVLPLTRIPARLLAINRRG